MGGLVQIPQHIMFKTIPSGFHYATNKQEWKAHREQQEENLDIAVKHLQEMYDDAASGVGRYFDISKASSNVSFSAYFTMKGFRLKFLLIFFSL